jgi:hypothetical protein
VSWATPDPTAEIRPTPNSLRRSVVDGCADGQVLASTSTHNRTRFTMTSHHAPIEHGVEGRYGAGKSILTPCASRGSAVLAGTPM